jgi:hypothetical protein
LICAMWGLGGIINGTRTPVEIVGLGGIINGTRTPVEIVE